MNSKRPVGGRLQMGQGNTGFPDLVTIEFVNDAGFTAAEFERVYSDILNRLKACNAEVIFITPHFTLPSWMGFKGLKEKKTVYM